MLKALGIDVASSTWESNGSALLTFDADRISAVRVPALAWPTSVPLTPGSLADAIDAFARAEGVSVVSLDGPQGWRAPSTPLGSPGVGRRCEYACRTQGKTGVYPQTYPSNQRPWIEFSIELFAALLEKPAARLADSRLNYSAANARDGYLVAECFPTSIWRASGLKPLPGKNRTPPVSQYAAMLASRFNFLPQPDPHTHDDLQALVAALAGVAIVGGPAVAEPHGVASAVVVHPDGAARRVEGIIWNARPPGATPAELRDAPEAKSYVRGVRTPGTVLARVTQRVLDQIASAGANQALISLRGLPAGSKRAPLLVTVLLEGEECQLIVGDSHAAWASHQEVNTNPSFERLFAFLSDRVDAWIDVTPHGEDAERWPE